MKSQKKIPTSKVQRATKFVKTGVKVGGNYIKHYAKKAVNPSLTKDQLHEDNARDIYNSLSELKGSALKVAQMMSMEKNVLPKAYSERFTMAQYNAPPLSGPLVVKTFKQYFGKSPQEIFDKFNMEAVNAASIGQVHEAFIGDKKLAVKVQYPGVADSIESDLKMVRPFAQRLLKLNEKDIDKYMGEVKEKLTEETNYELELARSVEISEAIKAANIGDLAFTNYYPEYSSTRILTMDWLEGTHLTDFMKTNPSQEVRNKIGQSLWDFYDFQMHNIKKVHADPHPGNFLMREDGSLGVIDFGCVKEIPHDFYDLYFVVLQPNILDNQELLDKALYALEFLYEDDTPEEIKFFKGIFQQMIELLCRPFRYETFDFGNDAYFEELFKYGEKLSSMKELRESTKSRGSHHSLYLNRTYFGLYSMLNELKANIRITKPFD
jgi:predicted unusual protein kinase regulating ubiquinone biosynthesis (AarF/ABC1/UbiB family)